MLIAYLASCTLCMSGHLKGTIILFLDELIRRKVHYHQLLKFLEVLLILSSLSIKLKLDISSLATSARDCVGGSGVRILRPTNNLKTKNIFLTFSPV